MQNIREMKKMQKTIDFGHFSPFWLKFWIDAAQNVQFSSFPEKKQKRNFLTERVHLK